jgi:hypothetical protein
MKQQSRGMLLGGITIPERHRDRNDEAQRITTKMSQGISFFTSQVIYNIDIAIWFLADYAKHCHEHKLKPARIVFTFAPFGSERTVKFMEWLGIEIPIGTQKRVLTRKSLRERVEESMRICWSNWRRILDYWKRNDLKIPIGFSVEAVSKSRMESRGAVVLFKACRELMDSYYDGVQDTLLKRMLNDDATYIVQTKDGGATISKLTDEEGPTLFATLPKMETSSNKGLRRIPTKPDFPALLKPKKKIAVPSIATPAAPLTVELQSVESPLPTLTTLPVDVPATNNSASI